MAYTAEDAIRDIIAEVTSLKDEGEHKEYIVYQKAIAYDSVLDIINAYLSRKIADKKSIELE